MTARHRRSRFARHHHGVAWWVFVGPLAAYGGMIKLILAPLALAVLKMVTPRSRRRRGRRPIVTATARVRWGKGGDG